MPLFPDQPDAVEFFESEDHFGGGFVDNAELHLLAPTQVAALQNVRLDVIGRGEKIRGVAPRGVGSNAFPRSLAEFHDPLGSAGDVRQIVAQYGSKLFRTDGDNTFSPVATAISLYDTPYRASQGHSITGRATLFFGTAVPHTNVSLWAGNLIAVANNFGATEINTVRPRAVAFWQERLWAFNSAQTGHGPGHLLWSNVGDGRNFSNGQSLVVDRRDAGVAILPTRGADPRLLLFNERSVYELLPVWTTDGFFPASANALDFTKSFLRPLIYGAGAVATRAVINVGGIPGRNSDVLYLSRDGIRDLNRSVTDAITAPGLPLSYPIQSTIDRINFAPVAVQKATAAYWNGVAYFAVPVDGATENNLIIAYDVNRNSFWTMERAAADFTTSRMDASRKFFFLSSATGITESYNSGSGFTSAAHLYETDTGARDPGRGGVPLDIQTRAYTFAGNAPPPAGLKYKKRWGALDLAIQADNTSASLAISYKVDDAAAWSTLTTLFIDPADAYPNLPIPLPFSFEGTKLLRRKVSLHTVPPGYRLQLRFQESSFARLKFHQITLYARPSQVRFST